MLKLPVNRMKPPKRAVCFSQIVNLIFDFFLSEESQLKFGIFYIFHESFKSMGFLKKAMIFHNSKKNPKQIFSANLLRLKTYFNKKNRRNLCAV